MGMMAIYKCNKCSNKFESQEGGGFLFDELRCEKCDEMKRVEVVGKNSRKPKGKVEKCKCSGNFVSGLRPMCPKCKSRDISVEKELVHYD
ncbi:Uncharacterised protein [Candidatus Bilamarchaeum dharawalense]|uniref:Uncharacterized protein n=1 Tax=Candidatus Bilamarchaeum dharawalense TaxID=2885759 RepID=A0A5E4LR14_9ARCH|nr:Uncharacterised protein [Candidatus Bilamarchaeum dharawalense]